MNTIFAVDGILLASYGISFMKLFKHRWRDISTGHFLTLSGVLLFLLAFFPGGRSLGDTVMTQDIHNTIAAILIVSFVFAPLPFIIRMAKQPRWRRTLIIVGVISVIKMFNYTSSVVVLLFSGPISEFGGLFQKLGLILDAIWIIFVTIQIKRLNGIAVV
jgi:hypothetical protein